MPSSSASSASSASPSASSAASAAPRRDSPSRTSAALAKLQTHWKFDLALSPDQVTSNVLLLFHGVGDTEANYTRFARHLRLPQTVSLALRAPLSLPFGLPGYMWLPSFEDDGGDIQGLPGEQRRLTALRQVTARLADFVGQLARSLRLGLDRVFLLGFSQGAVVATALSMLLQQSGGRLGGLVGVSSCLLPEDSGGAHEGECCPMLITHGRNDERVPVREAELAMKRLRNRTGAKALMWRTYDKGHAFIQGPDEAKDVMTFFSKHLYLRPLGLENHPDIVEVANVDLAS